MLLHSCYKIKKSIKNAKKKLHGRCTFDALLMHFSFFTKFTNIKKMEKKLRKFFPISKFTKLVNLLVLETQGSRCTKPYVFPYKVRPRTSMIYLCGATVARRSRVWSDHSRIMFGSCSDRFRIVNGVSPVFRAFAVDRIPL